MKRFYKFNILYNRKNGGVFLNKINNFQKLMITAICMLLIGFIFNLLSKDNNRLIFYIISQISYVLAFIIQIIALFINKKYKNNSNIVTTKDKILKGFAIISSIILLIIVLILFIYYAQNN